jgi:hypothetical protein
VQKVEFNIGKDFKAILPVRDVIEAWETSNELNEFRIYFANLISGLLLAIPNPEDLNRREKWRHVRGKKVYDLGFDGRKHDIKAVTREWFSRELERLGISLPFPSAARDVFWKKLPGKGVIPRFHFPLNSDLERELVAVRQDFQWYVEHCAEKSGADIELNATEEPSPANGKQKIEDAPVEMAVKRIQMEDLEALATSFVGERAQRMITEAQIEAGKIIESAREEAESILRSSQQQCDEMFHEAGEKLRAALGILSQPQHAKSSRDSGEKQA